MTSQMIYTALPGLPLIQPGDDLAAMILEGLERTSLVLQNGDVLVVGQKVVSKAEARLINLEDVTPSAEALLLAEETEKDPRLVEVILRESNHVVRKRVDLIIVEHKLGFICANAGVDHSNVRGMGEKPSEWVSVLPENPDASAQGIRQRIHDATGADIGVLIIDSQGRAWRLGTVGAVIGVAGFPALLDLRGRPDLYGDPLQTTQVGLADEVAAAASVLMGQADECRPVIHVRGLPYDLREGSLSEILRPKELDLFR
ncbi:MAG TPA: coenzyme F420-0:L-glutamate ligase [Anaerolineae bacterium]|nr:coenzyme F420-0:L-glutamate ligase [Anaerolineae bacterium]